MSVEAPPSSGTPVKPPFNQLLPHNLTLSHTNFNGSCNCSRTASKQFFDCALLPNVTMLKLLTPGAFKQVSIVEVFGQRYVMKSPKPLVGNIRKQHAHSAVVNNPVNRKLQIDREYHRFQELATQVGFAETYGLCARSSASWALYQLGTRGHFGEVAALASLSPKQALQMAHSVTKLHACLENFPPPKKVNKALMTRHGWQLDSWWVYLTDNYPKQFVVDDEFNVFLADVDGVVVLPDKVLMRGGKKCPHPRACFDDVAQVAPAVPEVMCLKGRCTGESRKSMVYMLGDRLLRLLVHAAPELQFVVNMTLAADPKDRPSAMEVERLIHTMLNISDCQ